MKKNFTELSLTELIGEKNVVTASQAKKLKQENIEEAYKYRLTTLFAKIYIESSVHSKGELKIKMTEIDKKYKIHERFTEIGYKVSFDSKGTYMTITWS